MPYCGRRQCLAGNHLRRPVSSLKRLGWLLGCFAVGGIVGFVGSTVTGSDLWYLAIPVAIAGVWMFLADPTKCEPPRDDRPAQR